MTDHAAPAGDHAAAHAGPHHPASFYVKIWAILLVLLAVSITGPMIGIWWLTMVTAFGIAIVKAYLVAANFMHLNIEKRLASMIIFAALILMALFFSGVAPDVMKHQGDQWVNAAARAETESRIHKEGEHGEKMGGHGSGADHGAAPHAGEAPEPAHLEKAQPSPAPQH